MTTDQPAAVERDALLALAIRCEREEPSGALDEVIGRVVGNRPRKIFHGGMDADEYWIAVTSNLDAAVTLIPDGWLLETLSDIYGDGMFYASLGCPDPVLRASAWGARTRALVLCAAALRAHAASLPVE